MAAKKTRKVPKGSQPTKTTGKPRRSTTGKARPNVDQTNWRTKLQQRRIKFDDDAKAIYLAVLSETNLKGLAAKTAGVSQASVRNHFENDPEFKEMYEEAELAYSESLTREAVRRGRDGYLEPVYQKGVRAAEYKVDEDGVIVKGPDDKPLMVPASIRKFSDRMLELELKKTNPEYRDKQTVDLNTGCGVLRVKEPQDDKNWDAEQEEKNKTRVNPVLRAEEERMAAKEVLARRGEVVRG